MSVRAVVTKLQTVLSVYVLQILHTALLTTSTLNVVINTNMMRIKMRLRTLNLKMRKLIVS